jgi:hypothetical protein
MLGQHCYAFTATTPCIANKGVGNYCGANYGDAAATCAVMCPYGIDSQCPSGTVEALQRLFYYKLLYYLKRLKFHVRSTLLRIRRYSSVPRERGGAQSKANN